MDKSANNVDYTTVIIGRMACLGQHSYSLPCLSMVNGQSLEHYGLHKRNHEACGILSMASHLLSSLSMAYVQRSEPSQLPKQDLRLAINSSQGRNYWNSLHEKLSHHSLSLLI